jgi:hypothetical protein
MYGIIDVDRVTWPIDDNMGIVCGGVVVVVMYGIIDVDRVTWPIDDKSLLLSCMA